jgi:hypothetical protein
LPARTPAPEGDATGNCSARSNTLSTAHGYDSMTGLGAPGSKFVTDLAK